MLSDRLNQVACSATSSLPQAEIVLLSSCSRILQVKSDQIKMNINKDIFTQSL